MDQRQNSVHLTKDDIDKLVGSPRMEETAAEALHLHLSTCESCHSLMMRHLAAKDALEMARAKEPGKRTPDCAGIDVWRSVAAGSLTPERSMPLLEHAANCDRCGALLAEAGDEAVIGPSEEDQRIMEQMASATVEGRRKLAQRLAHSRPARKLPDFRIWAIAAAIVITLGAGTWMWSRGSASPDTLLASAYSTERTLELRFPGARHAVYSAQRGGTQGESPELHESEAAILRNLARNPLEPRWLQSKARLELLKWNPARAIAILEPLDERMPGSASILLDLATAHFEKAAAGQPVDYGIAEDLLSRALAIKPEDPVALFNRALVREKLGMPRKAAEDWEHFLRLESSGGWADEARAKLEALRQLLNKEGRGLNVSPAYLERAAEARLRAADQYLQIATTEWVPAFAVGKDKSILPAIIRLDGIMMRHHGDGWIHDMLAQSAAPGFPQAVELLSKAISENQAGHTDAALQSTAAALDRFKALGSRAGMARSSIEKMYALHRKALPVPCLEEGSRLEGLSRGYAWIAAQLKLEQSSCLIMSGRVEEGLAAARSGRATAEEAGFRTLALRGAGFEASALSALGRRTEAWALDLDGLKEYWSNGGYPAVRAQQFYDDMSLAAEQRGLRQLAFALLNECVASLKTIGNPTAEARARMRLAQAAIRAGFPREASQELAAAEMLFAGSNKPGDGSAGRADGAIELARAEAVRGDMGEAKRRLQEAERILPRLASDLVSQHFYDATAHIARLEGRFADAESALRSAVAVSERSLSATADRSGRLKLAAERLASYRELARLEWERGSVSDALDTWEAARTLTARSQGGVERERRSMTHRTRIAFIHLPDGILRIAYDNRGVWPEWTPVSQDRVRAAVRRLSALCADRTSGLELLRESSSRLSEMYLGTVRARLEADRDIEVATDGEFANVPFAALLLADGRFLGEKYRLVMSQGARRQTAPSVPPRAMRLLAVGAPASTLELAANYPPLPDALEEARAISAKFSVAALLTGREATIEAVEREIRSANLFHFAGHASRVAGRPALLLASADSSTRPAWWDAEQVLKSGVACRIVVLSACATAQSEEDPGMAPENLVTAFLLSGVRDVVASRWNVDSRMTRVLMEHFYAGLQKGWSAAESMRFASAAIAGRGETSHPYYWAGFSVFTAASPTS